MNKSTVCLIILLIIVISCTGSLTHRVIASPAAPLADNPNPPASPVKLIFIHHSTGGNWLASSATNDPGGDLGQTLMDNNYFVSATNYGWGPNQIGSSTDIPNWPEWFTGPDRDTILAALYTESGQNICNPTSPSNDCFGDWPRLATDPGGPNEIIMFKSCFPNSDLYGNPNDPPDPAPSGDYTVGNAKAVYNNILTYFATRQDKLFIIITAPPLQASETAPERADNARAFNNWLVNDWLSSNNYTYTNVAVFDYYNVLTSNGSPGRIDDPGTTDEPNDYALRPNGNHHYWNGSAIIHPQTISNNYSAYPSGDSHPTTAGHQKATSEFVQLLNVFYHRWKSGAVVPTLHLTAPNGGESWPVGSQQQIQWSTTGSVAQVNLYYSTDNFSTRHNIALAIANANAHTWTTPITPSTSVKVRVESVISPTTIFDVSDADFTLANAVTYTIYLPIIMRNYVSPPPISTTVRPLPDTTNGIHVFNDQLAGWNMTEEQFQFAATHYDGTQKMARLDADHLRTYNSNFVILHYRLGLGLGYRGIQYACEPTGDWLEIIEGNDWVQEWPGDANVVESWFYHWPVTSTTRVLNCDWGWYLMNLDDPAWRTYWSGEVLRQLQANDDDGLFADSFSVPNYLGFDRYVPNLPELDDPFETEWAARIERFITFMQEGSLADYYFIPNAGQWVTTRDPTDYSGADGVMIEGFGGWGNANYFELADWQLQMDRILGLVNQDKAILAQQYINADDVADRMFLMGNYLLIKGRYTYLNFELDLDPEWFPEYDIPIGSPIGGIPANIDALWNEGWGVYTRTYTSGLVLVNPTTLTQTVNLGGNYYQAIPSGGGFVPTDGNIPVEWTVNYTPVTSVTLPPNRAAVLLNTAP